MNRVSQQQWQQAKAVFSEALEHPKQGRKEFVEQACAGDSALRAEVESLLKSYDEAQSFLETPAVESAAESLVGQQHQFEVGQRVKHYEIIKLIGEGGMGEVYLAKDTILGRRIALKMLPQYVRGDVDRLRRFKHEARAASTLSHPNVCVIHEVGETDDGHPFITMEYIDGITLRQLMNDGPMKFAEALDIAIQIADALSAAHEAGIVHRDIKPENVMIRRDGYIKVLDFGLAKLSEHRARGSITSMSTLMFNSSPGMVMGTAAYMSPEQARGVAVDMRTDVWSLGVVLYEMISGQAPFTGTTPTDVVIAIVEKEHPPLSQVIPDAPRELERIIKKALRKDPEERYQIAKEMSIDLRSLRRDLELDRSLAPGLSEGSSATLIGSDSQASTGQERAVDTDQMKTPNLTTSVPPHSPGQQMRLALIVSAVVIFSLIAFGIYKFLNRPATNVSESSRFERINVMKLTTNGNALFAAVSQDGKYVAYINSVGGKESLWLRQVGSAGNLEIIPPRDGHYAGLLFSPDGNFIYFAYSTAGSNFWDIYRLPVLGQGATAVKANPKEGPTGLSHDGKRIAFIRYENDTQTDALTVANTDGSNEQVLAQRKWPERFSFDFRTIPVWASDDQSISIPIIKNDERGYYVVLYEFHLSNRTENIVPLNPQRFEQPAKVTLLSDTNGVILSGKAQGASFAQVWYLGRDGSARTITNDLSDYRDADMTSDSRALVTIQTQTLSNLWVSRKDDLNQALQITSGFGRYFDLSFAPDGKIIYASDASGSADIYEMSADGATVKQLTSGVKRNYAPAVSPDNRFITFHSNRSGVFQIWRMDRDGNNPVQLTYGNSESNWPKFSADSKWIFYQHFESGVSGTVWKIPAEGGSPTRVVDGFTIHPVPSPDGKWLASWWNDGKQQSRWGLSLISLETGKQVQRFEVPASANVQWDTKLRWTPDSRSLVYVDAHGGIENLTAQPIEGGPPKQITNYGEAKIFSYDWSKDGALVTSRGVITTDVVLISDAKK
ncbi:MAG TPA: protein kinase [Pyrinomonadaceae bacterium]|jgi:serine/threonine protein kinase